MNARVLVADDNPKLRLLCREILTAAGCEVIDVEDGSLAVEQFKRERPDLILLDVAMPKLDGLQVLAELRAIDPACRVIMLSALGQQSIVHQARRAGAFDFLVKPIFQEQLLRVVKRALDSKPCGSP